MERVPNCESFTSGFSTWKPRGTAKILSDQIRRQKIARCSVSINLNSGNQPARHDVVDTIRVAHVTILFEKSLADSWSIYSMVFNSKTVLMRKLLQRQ
jgi:hypothetical protein